MVSRVNNDDSIGHSIINAIKMYDIERRYFAFTVRYHCKGLILV